MADDISLVDTATGEAIIGKVDFEGGEQDFTSVFRFYHLEGCAIRHPRCG